jgi:hypothetical protein
MALNIETKRINTLQAITGIANNDSIIVELAGGGTKRMTYATLLQNLTNGIADGDMKVAIREQRCINEGIDGIEWDLAELMTLVRNGEFNKFAIGDSFVDTETDGRKVHWRIYGKKTFNKWQVNGASGTEVPNTITCLPDKELNVGTYNETDTNAGGYAGSEMPAYLENTILPRLSVGLRSYIKETQIYENNKGSWAPAMRKMRLPTVVECTGNQGWADQRSCGVCSQLPLMRAIRHRIRPQESYEPVMEYWCLDPVASNNTSFCYMDSNGTCGYEDASNEDMSIRPEIVLG